MVAVVGGKKEYVHGGEFYHFILLALTFSPFSPLPPLLPFTGNQDFSGHAQQRVTRLEFLRLSFPLPSASTSILVLQIKQLAYWPWGHFFFSFNHFEAFCRSESWLKLQTLPLITATAHVLLKTCILFFQVLSSPTVSRSLVL